MIKKILKNSSSGMTMLELAAAVVVVSIIAIGMTSGAQAVMLHYHFLPWHWSFCFGYKEYPKIFYDKKYVLHS